MMLYLAILTEPPQREGQTNRQTQTTAYTTLAWRSAGSYCIFLHTK